MDAENGAKTTATDATAAAETISTLQDWQAAMSRPALLVLLGGAHCGVCNALKPRIANLLQQTPALAGLALATVDCALAPAVCAQLGVFSVPVLRLYLGGPAGAGLRAPFQPVGGAAGAGAATARAGWCAAQQH